MVRNTMVVPVEVTGGIERTRSMTSASASVLAARTFSQ